jgi:cyclic pyranopterin phosphate synthase
MSDLAPKLTHLNEAGQPAMVNVGAKAVTTRVARARARVRLGADILALVQAGDLPTRKGPVFQTAIIAGIMAAKKTSDLMPPAGPRRLPSAHRRSAARFAPHRVHRPRD